MWQPIADTTSFFRPLCRLSLTSSANSPKGGSNSASEVRLCSRAYQKTDWLSEISSHIPIILLLLKYGVKTRGRSTLPLPDKMSWFFPRCFVDQSIIMLHLYFVGQTIIVYTSSYAHDYTTYMYNIQVFMHNFLILCILSNLMNTFAQFHSIF